jgi:uncharacterized protein (DUF1330 family)
MGDAVVTSPIYVVASLWIEEGSLAAFEAYERKAAGIMNRYGGSIERVVRSSANAEQPDQAFEVHLVRFPNHEMFARYCSDPELQALSPERNAAITRTTVVVGKEIPAYAA